MKRFNWLLVVLVVLCLAMIPLAGCISKSKYEALQAEQATLLEENTSLKVELEGVQSDLVGVRSDLVETQANLAGVQADCDELNTKYEAVGAELAEIKEVYPPTYFDNYNELDSWASEHCRLAQGADIFRQHLDLQKMALADGYIWSVELSREGQVMSHVVAGDSVYWVWLDGFIEWIGWK